MALEEELYTTQEKPEGLLPTGDAERAANRERQKIFQSFCVYDVHDNATMEKVTVEWLLCDLHSLEKEIHQM